MRFSGRGRCVHFLLVAVSYAMPSACQIHSTLDDTVGVEGNEADSGIVLDTETETTQDTGQFSGPDWLAGSWGIWFQMTGGRYLDDADADYVAGAQEIADKYLSMGHVAVCLTMSAFGLSFTLRDNTLVDVAAIHPDFVPSIDNEQKILNVIDILKNSEKKIILYTAAGGAVSAAYTEEQVAAWEAYIKENDNGDEGAAYRRLIRGYIERLADSVDAYWFDQVDKMPGDIGAFVAMVKEVDPTAYVTMTTELSYLKDEHGEIVYVASDGVNDTDTRAYPVVDWRLNNEYSDFTPGHVSPMTLGAPPNSWAYEEFSIPRLIASPVQIFGTKSGLGHALIPMRDKWSVAKANLVMSDPEQAYRFVRRITDGGCGITFATTTAASGQVMDDEQAVLQEVDRRMRMRPMPDYVPYNRPEGAYLVGETP